MGQHTSQSSIWHLCARSQELITLRPTDANEVVEAWRVIAGFRHEPVALILTRQAVPTLDRTKYVLKIHH